MKLLHSDSRENLIKDFFVKINFPPMRALEFITGHVIYIRLILTNSNRKPPRNEVKNSLIKHKFAK